MKIKNVILAIFLYMFFSLSGVFMKYASLSNELIYIILFYGLSMLTLAIFAVLWQKLLVKYDLSKVYIFKTTTIIWGMIFGYLLFSESITLNMIVGSIITMVGISVIILEERGE